MFEPVQKKIEENRDQKYDLEDEVGEWFRFQVPDGEYEVPDTTDLGFSGNYANLFSEFPKKPGLGKEAGKN
jgi:hypothetical protein